MCLLMAIFHIPMAQCSICRNVLLDCMLQSHLCLAVHGMLARGLDLNSSDPAVHTVAWG